MARRIDAAISGMRPSRTRWVFQCCGGSCGSGLVRGEGGPPVGGHHGERSLGRPHGQPFSGDELDHLIGVGQGAAEERCDERDLRSWGNRGGVFTSTVRRLVYYSGAFVGSPA